MCEGGRESVKAGVNQMIRYVSVLGILNSAFHIEVMYYNSFTNIVPLQWTDFRVCFPGKHNLTNKYTHMGIKLLK